MRLSHKILDITDDPNGSILKEAAADGVHVPLYVLNAEELPKNDGSIPDELFAFRSGDIRKYACDTKANTWASGLYFLSQGHAMPKAEQKKVASKILQFHETHGITPPIMLEKVASGKAQVPTPTIKSTDQNFALEKTASGSRPQYPIDTWDQVSYASAYFEKYASRFAPQQCREYCVKLADRLRDLAHTQCADSALIPENKEAQELKTKCAALLQDSRDPTTALPDIIQTYSSNCLDKDMMKFCFNARTKIAKEQNCGTEVAGAYQALLDNRGSIPLEKFATVLESIDKVSGISKHWNKRIPDPYLSLLKIAEDQDDAFVFNERGIRITARQIRTLSGKHRLISTHFDPSFAREFCHAPDPVTVFKALPLPDKLSMAELVGSL